MGRPETENGYRRCVAWLGDAIALLIYCIRFYVLLSINDIALFFVDSVVCGLAYLHGCRPPIVHRYVSLYCFCICSVDLCLHYFALCCTVYFLGGVSDLKPDNVLVTLTFLCKVHFPAVCAPLRGLANPLS